MASAARSHPGSVYFLGATLLALGMLGCGATRAAVGANGTHVLTCGNGMKACITKAESICKDNGYHIVEGVSVPKILGGSTSAYKTKTESAELTIRCGMPEEEDPEETDYRLPPRTDAPLEEPVADEPIEPVAPQVPERVCTPGATQQCVGAGACQGGQTCLPTGQGFGSCDCGSATAGPSNSGPTTVAPGTPDLGPQKRVPGAAPEPTPLSK